MADGRLAMDRRPTSTSTSEAKDETELRVQGVNVSVNGAYVQPRKARHTATICNKPRSERRWIAVLPVPAGKKSNRARLVRPTKSVSHDTQELGIWVFVRAYMVPRRHRIMPLAFVWSDGPKGTPPLWLTLPRIAKFQIEMGRGTSERPT